MLSFTWQIVGNKKQRVTEQSPPKMDSTEVMLGTRIEIMHEHVTNAIVTDKFLSRGYERGVTYAKLENSGFFNMKTNTA